MLSHYQPLFLYRGGIRHKKIVISKFVSFRILQSEITAAMFNYIFFFSFN
jgi:hypothetical protein